MTWPTGSLAVLAKSADNARKTCYSNNMGTLTVVDYALFAAMAGCVAVLFGAGIVWLWRRS
jgi:hypothetical protein